MIVHEYMNHDVGIQRVFGGGEEGGLCRITLVNGDNFVGRDERIVFLYMGRNLLIQFYSVRTQNNPLLSCSK